MPRWINSFRFPNDLVRNIAAKAMQDVKNVPSLADLVAVIAAMFLGGQVTESKNFLRQVDNLTYHSLAGTSTGIFKHFWQIYKKKKFQGYDFGEVRKELELKL